VALGNLVSFLQKEVRKKKQTQAENEKEPALFPQ
jgi:hypothetical protein